ncbi:MAG: hypothetical protein ACE5KZ_00290 [Candidatus Scalinduaceae bacterium]
MNIPDIRKNKFWIVVAGAIISMVILYFLFANPYRLRNVRKAELIENKLTQLDLYARKGLKIINKKWIEAGKSELHTIEREQLKYTKLLKEKDSDLEKPFTSAKGDVMKDEALWKKNYMQRVNLILDNFAKSKISFNSDALPFKKWGNEIPTRDKIAEEQKKFWIVEELLNIIQKKGLRISNLESINFKQEGFSSNNFHSEFYDIIPCTIKLRMDTEDVLFLINELSQSKFCFEIVSVNMNGKLNILRSVKLLEEFKSILPDTMVNVIIKAHTIDFKT